MHLSWKEHSPTFKLPNERLAIRGVTRFVKPDPRNLEKVWLIQVARKLGKSPTVTLLHL